MNGILVAKSLEYTLNEILNGFINDKFCEWSENKNGRIIL